MIDLEHRIQMDKAISDHDERQQSVPSDDTPRMLGTIHQKLDRALAAGFSIRRRVGDTGPVCGTAALS